MCCGCHYLIIDLYIQISLLRKFQKASLLSMIMLEKLKSSKTELVSLNLHTSQNFNKITFKITISGIEHRIGNHNFYFNETKGFFCLRNETADKCLRETKGRKHPRVNPLVVSKLRKFFSEHNQKFYELVGEDLGWPEE